MNILFNRLLKGTALSLLGVVLAGGVFMTAPSHAEAAITVFNQALNNNDYTLPGVKKLYPYPAWTSTPFMCFSPCVPLSSPAGMANNFNIKLAIDKAGAASHASNADSLNWFDYPNNGTNSLPQFSWNVHGGSAASQTTNKTGGEICKIIDSTSTATWTTGSYNSPDNNKILRYGHIAPGNIWQIANANDIGNSYIANLTCTTNALPANTLSASPTTITSGQSSTITFDAGANNEAQGTICTPVNFTVPTHEKNTFGSAVLVGGAAFFGGPDTTTYQYVGIPTGIQIPDTSGSVVVSPTVTTTYQYNCTNGNGTTNRSVTVTVNEVVPPVPTATLSANPTSITSGGSSTLTWSSANATSCTSGNFATGGAVSGSVSVSPTTSTTYSMSCTGTGGTSSVVYATVNVSGTKDLTVGPITPTTAIVGTAVTISATVANNGTASTGTSFTNNFERATSAAGAGATSIGTFVSGIPSGFPAGYSESNAQVSHTFPSAGTWYVRACADSTGAITESNESNNCSAWTAITVSAPAAPNLTAGSVTPGTATAGTAVTLSSTVSNNGTASTGSGFTNLFQVANNVSGTGAAIIGTAAQGVLAAGGSGNTTLSNTFTAGVWYVRVCADTVAVVAESNEGDNCGAWTAISVSAPLAPDLSVSATAPATATAGTAVTLSTTVSNTGTGSTGASFSNLFQVASSASGTGASDIGAVVSTTLAAGANTTAARSHTFSTAGTFYVRACADKSSISDGGSIAESNESNNCSVWTAVTVTAPPAPNLTAGLVTPATATMGTAVAFSSTITNIGNASTGSTFTDVFQVADDAAGTGAAVIGTVINVGKTAGQSGVSTLSYTFTTPGTKYVRACADNNASMAGTIVESNESDNCSAWRAVSVSGPNLVAGSVTPITATMGTAVTLSSTVSNTGSASTGSTFTDVFQVANDASGTGATVIGTFTNPVRTAGTSNVATLSYTFTSGGAKYVRVCADQNASFVDAITETNESDNCGGWTAITVSGPNLTAGSVTPTAAVAGTPVTFSSTVTNNGAISTGVGFTNLFQVALDSSGTGATDAGTYANPVRTAGTSNAATLSYTFTSPGTKYVRVCADKSSAANAGSINETSENDNCSVWTAVVVTSPPTGPNLSTGAPTPTVAVSGTPVTVSATVTNIGNSSTGVGFTNLFQFDNDSDHNTVTATQTDTSPVITAGNSDVTSVSRTFATGGTWYVRVCADNDTSFNGAIIEMSETDNCSAWTSVNVSGPTGANLIVGALSPASATAGTPVTVSIPVTNNGAVSTGAGFTNLFQFDNDVNHTTVTSSLTDASPTLGSGLTDTSAVSMNFPTAGTWYVRACADNNTSFVGVVTESDESDNCGAWTSVTVTATAGPNLITGPVTPITATAGTAVSLRALVTNAGSASTVTTFLNVFQTATDANGTGATAIGTYTSPARVAGATVNTLLSYTFATPGTYYVRVCADNNASFVGTIAESNENDNCGAWTAVSVGGVGPTVDLVAGTVIPNVATAGVPTTFSSLMVNSGTGSTGTGFTNLFQFDADVDHVTNGITSTQTDTVSALGPSGSEQSTVTQTFPTASTWYVRTCTDNDASFVGTIAETNEANNCSAWRTVTVSAPTGAGVTSCTVSSGSIPVGGSVTWTASPSGLGTYTWAPSEDGAAGGTGSTLNRTYGTAGTYGMAVTAGGGSVNCPNVIVGASEFGTAEPVITTSPERVVPRGTTQITVSATGVDDRCVLTGPGITREFIPVAGVVAETTVTTLEIENQSVYTFTCDDVEATAKAIVNIIPVIQEF